MNRKITILGNSAAGAAAAAVLSKHNTVTVTMDPADCADAEYVLIAYKTKFSKLKKNYDTAAIEKALPEVRKAAPTAYIAIQSAVPLGFTYNMGVHLLCDCIFACPALVRPSFEMQDMETPSRIVVGASKYKPELVAAATQFAQLLAEGAENDPPILCMGDTEAEASALFADTFRALKAGFFNELDTYAETKGLHSEDIIRAVTLDPEIGQSLSIPNFGVIAASANQLETSYDDVPQRGAAPQHLISAAAKTGRTRRAYVVDRILFKAGYYESDFAGCCKCAGEVVFVGIHDPAAIARTPGCTPAIMRQVIDKLLASGPDTTVYIYDPRGEGAAMGLTDGCKVIEDAAFFRKNSDVILAPAAAREELAEVAGKVYCREIEL